MAVGKTLTEEHGSDDCTSVAELNTRPFEDQTAGKASAAVGGMGLGTR